MLKIYLTAYSKIERGITDINFSRLDQIAKIFNIKVEMLVASSKNDFDAVSSTSNHESKDIENYIILGVIF